MFAFGTRQAVGQPAGRAVAKVLASGEPKLLELLVVTFSLGRRRWERSQLPLAKAATKMLAASARRCQQ